MLKWINRIINIVMYSFLGVFFGHAIYKVLHYRTNPGIYALQSAPWYTDILLYGALTGVVLIVSGVIKVIIRSACKRAERQKRAETGAQ